MRPRTAITLVFFVNGALFASWASRIPALSDRVGASTGTLGLALLAPAVASVVTMPIVGRLLRARSSRGFVRLGMAGLLAAVVLPSFATNVPELAAALLLVGVANSALDIAMNAQGLAIERRHGRPILSSLHAAFSFGGLAGAAIGAGAAAFGVAPLPHLIVAALLFGLPGLAAIRPLLDTDRDPDASAPQLRWRRLPTRLALIGAVCFFCLLAEGGASDWSAKLVAGDLGGSAALGAVAYAVFSAGMGIGRLLTDRLWAQWGAVNLLRASGGLAVTGFGVALAIGTAPAGVLGFLALGLGLSGVIPTLFRAGADQPGVPTGSALSVVSSFGYLGFMAGPPLIGALAELTSLRAAAGLLVVAGGLVVALASAASPQSHAEVAQLRVAA